MNILIIKTAALGDVLRTTSILKPLKNRYPDANIYWLTKKNAFPLLKNNELIDKTLILEQGINGLDIKFDLVISLDDEENVCKLASKIDKEKLIGAYYDHINDRCTYTKDAEQWFGMGLLRPKEVGGLEKANELKKYNKKTVQEHLLEILSLEKKDHDIILNLDKKETKFGKDFAEKNNIAKEDCVVGLNTGAGGRWQLKKMDIEQAIDLANKLDRLGLKVLLLGGPKEKERNDEIKKRVNFDIIDTGTDNTLMQFASIIDLCNIVITSDSLCLHISLALKKQIIAFFGPTSSTEIEMYGRGKKIVPKIECICCYKKRCDKNPNCTKLIDIDEILEIVKKTIKEDG
jgi:lipopolysaccharide heptosyltransferase III